MASTYAKCEDVLVIDPELSGIDSVRLNFADIALVLRCSPWMARSWTLQEGSLPVNLKVRFADQVVPVSNPDSDTTSLISEILPHLWTRDVDRLEPETGLLFFSVAEQATRDASSQITRPLDGAFLNVWNALCDRDSTKADDTAAILSIFLGYNASEVMILPTAQRIYALLKTQSQLPVSLLFTHVEKPGQSCSWVLTFPTCSGQSPKLTQKMGSMRLSAHDRYEIYDIGFE